MRYAAAVRPWSSAGDARRRRGTGRTVIALLGVIGLFVAAVGVSIGARSAAAAQTWSTPTQLPVTSGGLGSSLDGVSCWDSGDCLAVGTTASGGAVSVEETHGSWGTPQAIPFPAGSSAALNAVSCISQSFCMAVGEGMAFGASGDSGEVAIAATWGGGQWGTLAPLPGQRPVQAIYEQLQGVSCWEAAFVNSCTAVGDGGAMGGNNPAAASFGVNGWSWSSIPAGAEGDLTAVSCSTPNGVQICVAAGDVGPMNQPTVPGTVTEVNGVWDTFASLFGIPSGLGMATGIGCFGEVCTVVGQDGNGNAFYEKDFQAPVEVPAPGNSGLLTAISCLAVDTCTAVGRDGNSQPFAVNEVDNTWATPVEVTLPASVGGGSGGFNGVSCTPDTAQCNAVGTGSATVPIVSESGVPPAPVVTFTGAQTGPNEVTVTYAGASPTEFARNGTDTRGTGPWNTGTLTGQPTSGTFTFENLAPGTAYTFTMTYGSGQTTSVTVTLAAQTSPPPPPGAPTPPPATPAPPAPPVPVPHGYWLVGSDGGIFTYGAAQFYGSTGALHLNRPVVGITPTADRGGYWLDASDGGIFSFGDAGFFGSIPGLGIAPAGSGAPRSLNAPIVGMVPTADGAGYFMVGGDGGVFTFGDAHFEGSCPAIGGCPGGAAVSVIPDGTGHGYWLVTAGGDVTPFGDAPSLGSAGAVNEPVVSAVRSFDGNGYYLLYPNGVVYAFGDALNYGSANGEVGGFNPAATIFTSADGGGYWIVSSNGSVITEGNAPYDGGANSLHLNGSIIAGTGW